MAKIFELKAIISAADKLSPVLKQISRASRATRKALVDIGGASGQLTGALGRIVAPASKALGVLGLGGIGGTAAYVVKTAAEFERFRTILETVEGSAEKAKASMNWVQEFAAKTPYELAQVTDAYVKLKAYGIDPQAGALRGAGDAAAAMGKDLNQSVEALADAMTGENERLKEFGITARKAGDTITYMWTQNGKTMAARANANSKAQIQATILGIWNGRYAGAMDKLSGTWDGMWSNLKDGVARFALEIGDAGLFPFLKGELKGVLEMLERMAKDGSMKKMAASISTVLVGAFKEMKVWIKEMKVWIKSVDWSKVWSEIKTVAGAVRDAVEALGGLKGIAIGLGALLAAQIVAPILLMGSAVVRLVAVLGPMTVTAIPAAIKATTALGASMMTAGTRANWLMGRLGALGAAGVGGWMAGSWLNDNLVNPAVQKLSGQKDASLGTWLYDVTHRDEEKSLLRQPGQQVSGKIDVRFENAPPGMRVSQGRTNARGLELNPDVGYSRAGSPLGALS